MKTTIALVFLALASIAFAGGEGSSAGMGHGGKNDIEELRNQNPSMNDCEFLDLVKETYDTVHYPPMPGTYLYSELQELKKDCGQN